MVTRVVTRVVTGWSQVGHKGGHKGGHMQGWSQGWSHARVVTGWSCGGRVGVMGVCDIPRIDSLSVIQFRTLWVQTVQASCFKNLTLGFSFKQTPIIPLTHTNKLIMTESHPFNPPTLKYWHIYNSTVNNPVFPMYCQPFPT